MVVHVYCRLASASGQSFSYRRSSLDLGVMAFFLRSSLRRATALLLATCFGLFTAETLIADAHDGDVGVYHPVSIETTTSHLGGSPSSVPTTAAHPIHVCHCVHAHGGVAPLPGTSAPRIESFGGLAIIGDRAPTSVDREPPRRPPIA